MNPLQRIFFLITMTSILSSAVKTVVITGAGRGIGLGMARAYNDAGCIVFATCRNKTPELEAIGINAKGGAIVSGIDVSTESGVASLCAAVGDRKIDILINNAGILSVETIDALDCDAMRKQFEVNAVAPLRITTALRKNLKKGSKVVMITSRMGSVAGTTTTRFSILRFLLPCSFLPSSHLVPLF